MSYATKFIRNLPARMYANGCVGMCALFVRVACVCVRLCVRVWVELTHMGTTHDITCGRQLLLDVVHVRNDDFVALILYLVYPPEKELRLFACRAIAVDTMLIISGILDRAHASNSMRASIRHSVWVPTYLGRFNILRIVQINLHPNRIRLALKVSHQYQSTLVDSVCHAHVAAVQTCGDWFCAPFCRILFDAGSMSGHRRPKQLCAARFNFYLHWISRAHQANTADVTTLSGYQPVLYWISQNRNIRNDRQWQCIRAILIADKMHDAHVNEWCDLFIDSPQPHTHTFMARLNKSCTCRLHLIHDGRPVSLELSIRGVHTHTQHREKKANLWMNRIEKCFMDDCEPDTSARMKHSIENCVLFSGRTREKRTHAIQ